MRARTSLSSSTTSTRGLGGSAAAAMDRAYLCAEAVTAREEAVVDGEQRAGCQGEQHQRERDVRLRVADEAVADQPDHVVDRVESGERVERLRQQRRGVEDAAQEDQRGEDERLVEGDVVELLR